MTTIPLRSGMLLLMLFPLVLQGATPANDKFEKAVVLVPGGTKLLNQNGSTSTPDVLDPFVGGVKLVRSVWYRFDAPSSAPNARLTIDDHAGVRAVVLQLADPDGSAGSLTFLTQTNNTAGNDVENLTFPVVAGQRYYVCIEANGLFDIKLRVPGQQNDFFDDATSLAGDFGSISGSNLGATDVDDVPATLPALVPKRGVWYTWTPSFTGAAVVDTNFSQLLPGTSFDTIISVFVGTTLANLVEVASDDDSGLEKNSRVVFNATAGTTYHIWVGGSTTDIFGPFTFSYYPDSSPGVLDLDVDLNFVSENQGGHKFRVRRLRAGSNAVNVTLSTSNAGATAGSDYTAINTVLNFPSGASGQDNAWQQLQTVTILPDTAVEPLEGFLLSLSGPTGGATLGSHVPTQIFITESSNTTAAGFPFTTMKVKESDGVVQIPLTRTGASGLASTFVSATLESFSTAQVGVDFQDITGSVLFDQGETQKFLTLVLIDDGLFRGTRVLRLRASAVTPFMPISGPSQMDITIEDDDIPAVVPGRLATVLDGGGISGSVDMTISTTGAVSGKVIMAKGSLPFKGVLVNGRLSIRLGSATSPLRTLTIQLLNPATKSYQITLSDGELGTVASAAVSATTFSKLNPCPVAGTYTFVDLGTATIFQMVAAAIKVDALGNAAVSGKLFDGTVLVASGAVDPNNIAWVGAALYAGKGKMSLAAQVSTAPQTISSVANFTLLRPGRANQAVELPPIDVTNNAVVARYIPPTVGQRALQQWDPLGAGSVDINGGGFGALNRPITVSTANKVTVALPNIEALKVTLTPATGFFSGSILPPAAAKASPISGVMLQGGPANGGGVGFFLNGTSGGRVLLKNP